VATHKVYVRAEDERWLKEQGVDTGPWIRDMVKRSLLVQRTRGTAHDPVVHHFRLSEQVTLTSDGDHDGNSDPVVVALVETRLAKLGDKIIWLLLWLGKHHDGKGPLLALATSGVVCLAGACHRHHYLHLLHHAFETSPL